tara:strand:+ start:257 stop:757 length:501 start_codon:yes stop_codon:yes gene_type:complete
MGTKRVGWARIKSLINENANQLGPKVARITQVTAATTLTAADSGTTVYWTHSSAHDVTLPSATVGLNFKFVLVAGAGAAHNIVSQSSDKIYGKVVVTKAAASDKNATQVVLKGAAVDKVKLHKSTTSLGGDAGDTIELVCIDAGYWTCTASLVSTGNPGSTAVLAN